MKRILIVNNNLHMGGVQKALISLLWAIRERYDITLLLFHEGGDCGEELPPEVRVVTARSGYRFLGLTKYDTHSLKDKLGRAFYGAISRVFGRKYAILLMGLGQKKLKGFDAAISYLHNGADKAFYGGCNEFVLKHVEAKRKITFLHCDYLLCGAHTAQNAKQYAKFDTIAACSQGCADAFAKANPHLKEKLQVVPNCHRFDRIAELARASAVELSEKCNIVTVARLGKEKGVERAVQAIAQLGSLKEKLHYYIVGDGIRRPLIENLIRQQGLEDTVTLCGMLTNPYGYIRAADWLLIPSYSEAAPLVIGEAASLGTPILSTQTSSAEEMILEKGLGRVCENSEAGIKAALEQLLQEPAFACDISPADNTEAAMQFDRCIG